MHGQAFEKFNLLIYWFQKSGITYPTLEIIKICPKRRLFNSKNDVFWMGFGFKIWRCDISSLEPVPHKQIGSADTPIGPKFRSCQYHLARWLSGGIICTSSQLAQTCKESSARSLPRANRAEDFLHVQGDKPRRTEGTLYVQSACLDVQRVLCTVKLSRNSIY